MKRFTKQHLHKKLGSIMCSVIAVLQLITAQGFAQPLSPADREQQNQKIRLEAQVQRERENKQDVFLQEGKWDKEESELPEEETSFPIDHIILTGDSLEKFSKIAKYLKRYEQKKIGIVGINLLIKRTTDKLIQAGFVTTRVVLIQQDLSTGTLKLHLVPGMIKDIRFVDPETRGNWRTAFPVRPGDILNLRDLEQGLEQLKRIGSREVDMQIIPSSEPGQSEVVITAEQKKRISLMAAIDDAGSKATGKLQMVAAVTIDNLFNANDIFRLNINRDGERKGSLLGSYGNGFSYSIPDGNWNYTLSQSKYEYHQTVASAYNEFIFSGTSEESRFNIEKLLHRDQSSKIHLEIGLTLKKSHNYVNDTEITVQQRKTTAFTIGLVKRKYIGQALLDVRLSHKRGVPWFNAQADPHEIVGSLPTLRYKLWNLDISYLQPIDLGKVKAQYKLYFSGQFVNDQLYAADCLSIGNRYTVRGFDGEETLIGERGFYLQNELSIPLGKTNHQIFCGLDYGNVSGHAAAMNASKNLLGSIVGFRGVIGKNAQYEVFVGWALHKPDTMQTAKRTYGFQIVSQI